MIKKILFGLMWLLPAVTLSAPITNPLAKNGEVTSIAKLLEIIIEGVTYISIPIIVLAFIYAGFKFVAAQGNATEVTTARNIFLYTLAGAAIILGSNVILEVVTNTTEDLIKNPSVSYLTSY